MANVTYIDHCGMEHRVSASEGVSLMRAAVDSNVPGIEGDCGGAAACGTCRVYVDQSWLARVGPPLREGRDMLEAIEDERPDARLACQIIAKQALDGLVVYLPQSQR